VAPVAVDVGMAQLDSSSVMENIEQGLIGATTQKAIVR